jgi:hypothetical protein
MEQIMSDTNKEASLKPLLDKMVTARQLSSVDAHSLLKSQEAHPRTEAEVLHGWLRNMTFPTPASMISSRTDNCSPSSLPGFS